MPLPKHLNHKQWDKQKVPGVDCVSKWTTEICNFDPGPFFAILKTPIVWRLTNKPAVEVEYAAAYYDPYLGLLGHNL